MSRNTYANEAREPAVEYPEGADAQETQLVQRKRRTLCEILKIVKKRLSKLTIGQIFFIALLILMIISGVGMQIIGMNFWLRDFPEGGTMGSYTVAAMGNVFFTLTFVIILVVYVVLKRPNIHFWLDYHGWLILIYYAVCGTVNIFFSTYGATDTPEILQTCFLALSPLFTAFFTKYLLRDPRSYMNPWIVVSFSFSIGGVLIAAVTAFVSGISGGSSVIPWTIIYFLSVPFTNVTNVFQAMYMRKYTIIRDKDGNIVGKPNEDIEDVEKEAKQTDSYGRGREKKQVYSGESVIVKVTVLFGANIIMTIMTLALLPADALPWFGGAPGSVSLAASHFSTNTQYMFQHPSNFGFCIIYAGGYAFVVSANTYINMYSPTLGTMIGQLSSPITEIILVIFPVLNVDTSNSEWYYSVASALLLICAAITYSIWEEISKNDLEMAAAEQKAAAEAEQEMVDTREGRVEA